MVSSHLACLQRLLLHMVKPLVCGAVFNRVKLQLVLGALLDLRLCMLPLDIGAGGRLCKLGHHLGSDGADTSLLVFH